MISPRCNASRAGALERKPVTYLYGTPSMSSVSRIRMSFEESAASPPATSPVACRMSARVLHAGRRVGAHVVDDVDRLIGDELEGREVDAIGGGIDHVVPGRGGEIARHGAVARTELAEIVGAHEAAGAVLVLHDDAGSAVDVLGEVLGEQPPLDVGRSTNREVDDKVEPLAFVEGAAFCAWGPVARIRRARSAAHRQSNDPPGACNR